MRKIIKLLNIGMIAIIIVLLIPCFGQADENTVETVKAKIIATEPIEEVKQDEHISSVQKMKVRIEEGEYENEEYAMEYTLSEDKEGPVSYAEMHEADTILVNIEEKEGEVTNLIYQSTVHQNYILYVIGAVLFIALVILGGKNRIISILISLLIIFFTFCVMMISVQNNWNLLLATSICAFVLTIGMQYTINENKVNILQELLKVFLEIAFASIGIYVLLNVIGISSVEIKIVHNFVNMRDLICAIFVLVSCGVTNSITVITIFIESKYNRSYKTKSDNIIEGQRSLKL